MAETIKIGGELESMATGKIVAAASAILDKLKNKTQELINQENTSGIRTNAEDIANLNAVVASLQQLIDAATLTGGTVANAAEVFVAAIAGLNANNVQAALEALNTRTTFPMIKPNPNTYVTNASQIGLHGRPLNQVVPETADNQGSDLDISDEDGYVIGRFSEGHIKTKNFDSSVNAMTPAEKSKLSGIENGAQVNDTDVEDITDADDNFDISDENGNVVLRCSGGNVSTKNFRSANTPSTSEDDSEANLNVADENGYVALELKDGHVKTKNFDSRDIASAALASIPASLNFIGHSPKRFTKKYQYIVGYGQSLSNGSDSYHAGDAAVPHCWMMGTECSQASSTLRPLVASQQQHPMISAVNSFATLYNRHCNKNTDFILSSTGTGGRSIAQLSKASRIAEYSEDYDYAIGGSGRYESSFLSALNAAYIATNGDVECPLIVYLQGERDYYSDAELGPQGDDDEGAYSCANDKDLYKQRMMDLKNDMQADIMAKTGQTYRPVFAIYQVSGAFVKEKSYGTYMSIDLAQIEFAQENEDVLLVCAPYFTPNYSTAHLTTNGYRWLGEYIAKRAFEFLAMASCKMPILPLSAYVLGDKIYLRLANVEGNLTFDEFTVETATNKGFELWLNNAYDENNISSIELSGDTVVITSSVSLTGKTVDVCYGGAKVGGTGNLRDTAKYIPLYTYWDDTNDTGWNFSNNTAKGLSTSHKPTDADGNNIIGKPYPMWNWCSIFKFKIQ